MAYLSLDLISEGAPWQYTVIDNNFAALENALNDLDVVCVSLNAWNWKHFYAGFSLQVEGSSFTQNGSSGFAGYQVDSDVTLDYENEYPGYDSLDNMTSNERGIAETGWAVIGKQASSSYATAIRVPATVMSLAGAAILVRFNGQVTAGEEAVYFALQVSEDGVTWTTLPKTVRKAVFWAKSGAGFWGDIALCTLLKSADAPGGFGGVRAVVANATGTAATTTIRRWNFTVVPIFAEVM